MYGVFYVMRMFFRVTILDFFSGFYGVFWRRERERDECGKSENETVAAVSFFVLLFWTFFGVLWGFLRRERERNENEKSETRSENETEAAEKGWSRSRLLSEDRSPLFAESRRGRGGRGKEDEESCP